MASHSTTIGATIIGARIIGVIHNLEIGGAEKIFCCLFERLRKEGYQIGINCFYQADSQIQLHELTDSVNYLDSKTKNPFVLIRKLANKIKTQKADLVISFMDQTNILALLSLLYLRLLYGIKIPVIVCERNNPARNLILKPSFPAVVQSAARIFRNLIYKLADSICVQTSGAKNYFKNPDKIEVIPNFVDQTAGLPDTERKKKIISVARLVPEKGLEELIKVFNQLSPNLTDWTLGIYGIGPLKEKLEDLIYSCNLQSRVFLHGKVQDLSEVYAESSIFVLNSEYEGFPNSLMEAMSNGCCCIARNCDYGPAEMINNNVNGILLKTTDGSELASALLEVATNDNFRKKLASQAVIDINQNFSQSSFYEPFLLLVSRLLNSRRR